MMGVIALIVLIGVLMKLKPSKSRKLKINVELVEKRQETHDTIAFTFMLPDINKKLGLKIGEHI
jgi:hypothetical protein